MRGIGILAALQLPHRVQSTTTDVDDEDAEEANKEVAKKKTRRSRMVHNITIEGDAADHDKYDEQDND